MIEKASYAHSRDGFGVDDAFWSAGFVPNRPPPREGGAGVPGFDVDVCCWVAGCPNNPVGAGVAGVEDDPVFVTPNREPAGFAADA